MTKSKALVSVIVPVFNGEAFLADALASIFGQHGPATEVIVIDDGSTDRSADIARATGNCVRYHYQENGGPSAARNRGLAMATGEFIAFLDADDLWPQDKLNQALGTLELEPGVDVVMGRCQFLKQRSSGSGPGLFDEVLAPRFYLQLGSAVFRSRVFDRVGPFDAELRFSEDIDWFLRAREKGARLKAMDAIGLLHRLHESNMTRGTDLHKMKIAQVLKKSLDRRRAASGDSSFEVLDFIFDGQLPRQNP